MRIQGGLSYDTVLRWTANPEPDLAGYEIVWRETTDSDWKQTISVGNVTTYTVVNMSKDNFFFGVRAVDTRRQPQPGRVPAAVGSKSTHGMGGAPRGAPPSSRPDYFTKLK